MQNKYILLTFTVAGQAMDSTFIRVILSKGKDLFLRVKKKTIVSVISLCRVRNCRVLHVTDVIPS